ncbi:MAG: MFS transporter [Clostridia bacterium]
MPYYRRNLIVLWITTFLASASWTQVVPFLPLYLQELGVAENLAQWSGLVVSMQFAGGLVMAPIWGKIADQRGRKLMTIRAGLCLSAIYFLTGLATAPWHVAVLRFLNGALTGFIPSSMSLVATNTPQHLAARYVALLQTASAAGSVAGPVIGGVLASLAGIRGALFLSAANVLLSVILVIVLVEERNKVAPEKKSTLLEDFSTALHNPALVRVMGITILAMIGTVSIQPILTVYVGELAADPSRATAIAGVVYALPGIVFALSLILGWITPPIPGLRIYGTLWIIFVAYLGRFLALALQPVSAAWQQVDPSIEEAAKVDGAGFGQALVFVLGPLIAPSLGVAALLVFLQALVELTLSALLAGSGTETLGWLIFGLEQGGYTTQSAALSTVLLLTLLAFAGLLGLLRRRAAS